MSRLSETAWNAAQALPDRQAILAYSGGIDSGILAALLAQRRKKVSLLTRGQTGSSDVLSVIKNPKATFQVEPLVSPTNRSDVELAAKCVTGMIRVSNLPHFEDCVAFWMIAENARRIRGTGYVISANGPDELFCGYDRFRRLINSQGYDSMDKEIRVALIAAEDLSHQVMTIMSHFGLGIEEPFLSNEFRKMALQIPVKFKILPNNDLLRKRIWRCFGRSIGLPNEIVLRPKKAMQYGMGIHGIVSKMIKQGSLKVELEDRKR